MKAEAILQSNLLDIIFENRNKEYGAYMLRLNYPQRLYQSLGYTILIVMCFSWIIFHSTKQMVRIPVIEVTNPISIIEPPVVTEVKKVKPLVKSSVVEHIARTNLSQAQITTPIILKDKFVLNAIPDLKAIDTSVIGLKNINGIASISPVEPSIPATKGGSNSVVSSTGTDANSVEIFNKVEVMPEFPGGKEALRNYLLRNITQPNDLEASEKVVVIASFVVNKLGKVENINISKKGRNDLDNDVVNVIKRMPNWKPGIQNGKTVAVYYSLPITFISNESN